jgi:hypothetical protein
MTAFAQQEQRDLAVAEEELVSQWRFDQFHRLGFDEEEACVSLSLTLTSTEPARSSRSDALCRSPSRS